MLYRVATLLARSQILPETSLDVHHVVLCGDSMALKKGRQKGPNPPRKISIKIVPSTEVRTGVLFPWDL